MIAKVIVKGPTRGAALNALERALRHTQVGGTVTNIGFLARLAAQPDFVGGDVDTGLIDRHMETLTPSPVPGSREQALAAIAALGLDQGAGPQGGFTLWAPLSWPVTIVHAGDPIVAGVSVIAPRQFRVTIGDQAHEVQRTDTGWIIDATPMAADIWRDGRQVTVFAHDAFVFDCPDPLDRGGDDAGDGSLIEAPMPGLVKLIAAQPGGHVTKGDRLAVLEAMKMEHALLAARDGVVQEVLVAEGSQVEGGAALIRLAPQEE